MHRFALDSRPQTLFGRRARGAEQSWHTGLTSSWFTSSAGSGEYESVVDSSISAALDRASTIPLDASPTVLFHPFGSLHPLSVADILEEGAKI